MKFALLTLKERLRMRLAVPTLCILLACLPARLDANDCAQEDYTRGVGLTLKFPVTYEIELSRSASAVLQFGLQGNLTAYTSDYDATNAGVFGQLEFRVYPRPRFRSGWLGLFASQKMLHANDGTEFEPNYKIRSVTSVGLDLGYKVWRKHHGQTVSGSGGIFDIFLDIEWTTYWSVSRGCFSEIEDSYSMVWLYFGAAVGFGNM